MGERAALSPVVAKVAAVPAAAQALEGGRSFAPEGERAPAFSFEKLAIYPSSTVAPPHSDRDTLPATDALPTGQARLTGQPGSALEQEADLAADRVMRMAGTDACTAAPGGVSAHATGDVLLRTCAKCKDEDKLHRKAVGSAVGDVPAPPIVHDVLRAPGRPLDAVMRAFMEPRFGHDFSGVRLHTGALPDASARAVDALAYTVGSNVVLRQGAPDASSMEGKRLLAHELAHVVQQHPSGAAHTARRPDVDGAKGRGADFSSVPLFAADRAQDARDGAPTVARSASNLASPPPDADSLHFTEPDEPDEVDADRFASAALDVMSHAAPASPQPVATPVAPAALPALKPAPAMAPAPAAAPDVAREPDETPEEAPPSETPEAALGTVAAGGTDSDGDDPLHRLSGAGVGVPLGRPLRDRLEPLTGMDLARVRIHADGKAGALARSFQARAFAHRNDIYFGAGEFAPGTRSGMHLLLHEVAHVVQHSGERPAPGVVARAPLLSGNNFHEWFEDIILTRDPSLIAEGVLPGGTTDGTDVSKLGYPDFYRSSASKKVPWVRGENQTDGSLKYVPIQLVGRKHPRMKSGRPDHEPTVDSQGRFTGDFPARFSVAEIKPVFGVRSNVGEKVAGLAKVGEGLAQSANYWEGFPNFARHAVRDGKSNVIPQPSSLAAEAGFIPPSLDYRKFQAQAANTSPAQPHGVFGKRRFWVYPLQTPGQPVLFYFHLPHPYKADDYTKALDDVFAQLEGLKKTLGKSQNPSAGHRKQLGSWALRPRGKAHGSRVARPRRQARIARKADWKAEHVAWEKEREGWDEKKAKPFLKTDEAKAIDDKATIDKKIHAPVDSGSAERGRRFHQVELFSGRTGKILGDIRYALAPVFDKIGPFFEWLKKKFNALIDKLKSNKVLSLSWVQTVFDAVMKALKTTVQEAVSLLFSKFQDCITGMIDNFIQGFVRDLTEELEKPFEEAKKAFFDWLGVDEQAVGQLVKDVEAALKKYEEISDAIMDAKRLVDEIKVYEWVIRGIVEAISCFTPPVAGCLWGLVAQLALPEIVDLAMTSDLFQDQVVRPLVRDLVKDIFDEPFSRIVSKSIDAIGLGKWAKGVGACNITPLDMKKIIDGAIEPGLKLGDPKLMQKRDEWSKKHEPAILDAASKNFVKKDGKPATPEEIRQLMERVKDLVPEAGDIKDAIAGARLPDGRIDFDKFSDWANGKVAARSRPTNGGGFSSDHGGVASSSQVKSRLDALDLGKVSPTRMVELMEDSRDDDGNLNIDQFARKVEKHLERQQLKRDIDARHPDMPGVPKQSDRDFTDTSGAAPNKDAMRDLVESLTKARLAETSAAEKVEAARRPDGKVDVAALKAAVDAAGSGAAQPSPATPAPSSVKPDEKKPDISIRRPATEGRPRFPLGPLNIGPQNFTGPGDTGTTLPGLRFDLPEPGDKKKD